MIKPYVPKIELRIRSIEDNYTKVINDGDWLYLNAPDKEDEPYIGLSFRKRLFRKPILHVWLNPWKMEKHKVMF